MLPPRLDALFSKVPRFHLEHDGGRDHIMYVSKTLLRYTAILGRWSDSGSHRLYMYRGLTVRARPKCGGEESQERIKGSFSGIPRIYD